MKNRKPQRWLWAEQQSFIRKHLEVTPQQLRAELGILTGYVNDAEEKTHEQHAIHESKKRAIFCDTSMRKVKRNNGSWQVIDPNVCACMEWFSNHNRKEKVKRTNPSILSSNLSFRCSPLRKEWDVETWKCALRIEWGATEMRSSKTQIMLWQTHLIRLQYVCICA